VRQTRVLYHLLRADFLERVRRYSFLVTLTLAVYLGYTVAAGQIKLWIGDARGLYNSAWVGALMTLVANTFLSLAGFYVVKSAVERDRRTGVGQILATTPMSKPLYTLGKAASNFAVLAAMVGVLVLAAVAAQFVVGEETRIEPWPLLAPFLLVCLPMMALVAATAVLFETIPFLRGGFGNVVWFFVWVSVMPVALSTQGGVDPMGLTLFSEDMRAKGNAALGNVGNGFVLGGISDESGKMTFRWDGVDWTPDLLLSRLAALAAAVAVALLAALLFDRFDPARALGWKRRPARPEERAEEDRLAPVVPLPANVVLTPLPDAGRRFRFGSLLIAELRLLLIGQRWWWYAVAGGLLIASLAAPLESVSRIVLPLAWIWPILLWSSLGTREIRHATSELIFSAAWPLQRQLPATWLAGVLLAMAIGSGVALRLALAGNWASVGAWAVGALFIPTAALAFGVWSGTSRLFEAVYLFVWYIGPLQQTAPLDFMGAVPEAVRAGVPLAYLAATAALGISAVVGRRRRLKVG
jgi:hypothetical protein